MIKINISEILGKRKMSRKQLADLTNIRYGTICDLYYEKNKSIKMDNLDKLCEILKCNIEDIIKYENQI